MSSTMLFAELLVIGSQTFLNIFLLSLVIVGYEWLLKIKFNDLGSFFTSMVLFLIPFIYTLGIIFDRFADFIFSSWEKKIRTSCGLGSSPHTSNKRFSIVKENASFSKDIEYAKTRMRVVRAFSINILISVILLISLIETRITSIGITSKMEIIVFILAVGVLLLIGSLSAWRTILYTYFGLINSATKVLDIRETTAFDKKAETKNSGKSTRNAK